MSQMYEHSQGIPCDPNNGRDRGGNTQKGRLTTASNVWSFGHTPIEEGVNLTESAFLFVDKDLSNKTCLRSKRSAQIGSPILQHVLRLKKQARRGRSNPEKCLT